MPVRLEDLAAVAADMASTPSSPSGRQATASSAGGRPALPVGVAARMVETPTMGRAAGSAAAAPRSPGAPHPLHG